MKEFTVLICIALLLNLLGVANAQEFGILPYEGDEEPSQTHETDCESDSDCGWCGDNCVLSEPGMICPAVMPPSGYECVCIDRVCSEKKVKSGKEPQPLQMKMKITEVPSEKDIVNMEVRQGEIVPLTQQKEVEIRHIVGGPLKIFECEEYEVIELEPGEPMPSSRPICAKFVVRHIEMDAEKPLSALPENVGFEDSEKVRNVSVVSDNQTQLVRAEIVSGETGFHEVGIEKKGGGLVLESNGVQAKVSEASIKLESTGIYVETAGLKEEIKVLPDTAAGAARDAGIEVQEMNLNLTGQKPVYEINGTMTGRMLGLFPVCMSVETSVNAGTGEVGAVRKPWWGFMVF